MCTSFRSIHFFKIENLTKVNGKFGDDAGEAQTHEPLQSTPLGSEGGRDGATHQSSSSTSVFPAPPQNLALMFLSNSLL